jgi:hypothetical protein
MSHASGGRGMRWIVGLVLVSAMVGAGRGEKSATIRQVTLDAKARRTILREAGIKDRPGVEVRELRYLGPSMQFLAEVEVVRGEKSEAKHSTAMIGSGSWKEQRLILIVEPPATPGGSARVDLRAVTEYGLHRVLVVGSTSANHAEIPPLWFEWKGRASFETPGLTPAVLTREKKVLTVLEWKIVEPTRPGSGPEAPRVATLTVKAKPLFW